MQSHGKNTKLFKESARNDEAFLSLSLEISSPYKRKEKVLERKNITKSHTLVLLQF